jgi:hypothetical protein
VASGALGMYGDTGGESMPFADAMLPAAVSLSASSLRHSGDCWLNKHRRACWSGAGGLGRAEVWECGRLVLCWLPYRSSSVRKQRERQQRQVGAAGGGPGACVP